MAPRYATSGALLALTALGLALGCSGASFESGGNGRSGGGPEGGTSGKGGTGGDAGQMGGSAGKNAGAGGGSGSGARGGRGSAGGSSGPGGTSGTGGDGGTAGSAASGGTIATGGSANGGASGTAGSSPCVAGGECVNNGDQCSEGACCPCSHTCQDGVWGPPLCAPCAAPICPLDPPADGSECSTCQVPSDGCTWDQCPVDGPLYTGACVDDHWQITVDDSCSLSACCTDNGDCADHHCVSGMCKSDDARGCWDDDQCSDDEMCSGVWVCPCNADCGGYDEPGTCVPLDADCCLGDADCEDAGTCLRGVCKQADPAGGCWSDRECPGGTCEGESVCACGENCLMADQAGLCAAPLPLPL